MIARDRISSSSGTKTGGSGQSRTVKLSRGVYRAKIGKKCGHPAATTKSIKIG